MNPAKGPISRAHKAGRGFTLIELLVAMAVLAILLVAAAGLVNVVSKNTGSSSAALDSAAAANVVFERIALDIDQIVARPDIGNQASADPDNFLSLISEVPGAASSTGSQFFVGGAGEPALIHYRLGSRSGGQTGGRAGFPVLERSAVGVFKADSFGLAADATPIGFPTPAGSGGVMNSGDFDPLADGVVRVAVGSLDRTNGTYIPSDGSNLADTSTLVVTLAMIDGTAAAKATAADASAVGTALPMPDPGDDPLETWKDAWSQGAPDSVPDYVWSALRFYQRVYTIQ